MKIYLAARYSRRLELCQYRADLEGLGHVVTSRWLNGSHQIDENGIPIGENGEKLAQEDSKNKSAQANLLRQHFVEEDLLDVQMADCVISFTEPPRSKLGTRGGRHVEFGLAIALGKKLFVVGYQENLFHYLPQVIFRMDWESAKAAIGRAT